MKTEYIKPEMLIEEVELTTMIATSLNVGEDIEEGTTDTNGRRGSWGNLWDQLGTLMRRFAVGQIRLTAFFYTFSVLVFS